MGMRHRVLAAALLLAAALSSACGSSPVPALLPIAPTPGEGADPGSRFPRAQDGAVLPDPSLTPGATDPRLTAAVICAPGFRTGLYRNVPPEVRRQVYATDHVPYPQPRGTVELDHLIPIEAGGSNDPGNLWVQPALPAPGFHEKDALENAVHDEVCAGRADLADLQRRISVDWDALWRDLCGARGLCHRP